MCEFMEFGMVDLKKKMCVVFISGEMNTVNWWIIECVLWIMTDCRMDLVNFKNEMNIMIYIGVYLFIYYLFIKAKGFNICLTFGVVTVGCHY